MTPRSISSISTGVFGKAYLARAWDSRNELSEYERRGFAQFFYLTICGHIESVLSGVIKARLKFVNLSIHWESLPPMQYTSPAGTQQCSIDPIATTIKSLANGIAAEAESAPLSKLAELYAKAFGRPLNSVLSTELSQDLKALAALRNVFAHGRDLVMEFRHDPNDRLQGTLEENPLQFVVQRLQSVGVMKKVEINGANYDSIWSGFFSDNSLLHFYNAVRSIEISVRAASDFTPEQGFYMSPPLPELLE